MQNACREFWSTLLTWVQESRLSKVTGRVMPRKLPLEGSNLDYLIQSLRPRASKADKLTGNGVPTSIGALSVWHLCPVMSGETLAKCWQRVLLRPIDERPGESVDQAGVSFLRGARARTTSVGEPPIASTDLSRRSMLTEGSPDSIFATRD